MIVGFTSCYFAKPVVQIVALGEGLLFGELVLSAILAAYLFVFPECV